MASSTRSKTAVKRKLPAPSSFNPIYRHDVFTLLNRRNLEQAREVSRRFNNVISAWCDEKKPRRHLHELTIGQKSCRFKKNGQLDKATADEWRDWRDVSSAAGCCRELEGPSRELAGQLLYSSRGEGELISISMAMCSRRELIRTQIHDARYGYGDLVGQKKGFILATPNRLNEEGAFDALHLLKHINGSYFGFIEIGGVNADEHCLNAKLFSLLKTLNHSYRLFAGIAGCEVIPMPLEDSASLYLNAIRSYQHFSTSRFYAGVTECESNLRLIMDLIACSSELGERLMVRPIGANSHTLDRIIKVRDPNRISCGPPLLVQYFRDDLTGLKPTIPEFAITYKPLKKLPEACNSTRTELVELYSGGVETVFHFTTAKERRTFRAIFLKDMDGFHGLMRIKFNE